MLAPASLIDTVLNAGLAAPCVAAKDTLAGERVIVRGIAGLTVRLTATVLGPTPCNAELTVTVAVYVPAASDGVVAVRRKLTGAVLTGRSPSPMAALNQPAAPDV